MLFTAVVFPSTESKWIAMVFLLPQMVVKWRVFTMVLHSSFLIHFFLQHCHWFGLDIVEVEDDWLTQAHSMVIPLATSSPLGLCLISNLNFIHNCNQKIMFSERVSWYSNQWLNDDWGPHIRCPIMRPCPTAFSVRWFWGLPGTVEVAPNAS